nr:hypothetical protein L203_03255 [Cryptococcus depauperatus CBS 7841]
MPLSQHPSIMSSPSRIPPQPPPPQSSPMLLPHLDHPPALNFHYPPSASSSQYRFAPPPPLHVVPTHPAVSSADVVGGEPGNATWLREVPHMVKRHSHHTSSNGENHSHMQRRMTYQTSSSTGMSDVDRWKHWRRNSQVSVVPQLSGAEHAMGEKELAVQNDLPSATGLSQHVPQLSGTDEKWSKKRSRTNSMSKQMPLSEWQPPPTASHGSMQEKTFIPAILTREKKQKACSNCRKAKLKCLVQPDESVCVRCKARKEKCIFFAKGYDENWQQTFHTDLYAATSHLSQLSAAVQHILHHLVSQSIIPPLSAPLEEYRPPDRDNIIAIGDGQVRDASETSGNDREGKSKKRKGSEDETRSEAMDRGTNKSSDVEGNVPSQATIFPSYSAPRFHLPASALEKQFNSPTLQPTRLGPTQQPFRLPTVGHDTESVQQPEAGRIIHGTPTSVKNVTPSTGDSVSPQSLPPTRSSFGQPIMLPPTSELAQLRNYSLQSAQRHMTSSMRDEPLQIHSEVDGEFHDENGMEISMGVRDPRQDIIKKKIVSNSDALFLSNYFHSRLGAFLYGYRLQFRKFPYLEGGPSTITPLILAVICLVASEHCAEYLHYRDQLIDEVLALLETSPAESWQRFEGKQAKDFGDVEGDDPLDAEFGLGPEEIVAACVLATYITERAEGAVIAQSAFRWARGWIKLLSSTPPRVTLAETAGFVPPERQASVQDMARVWLLCYIVDSTERLTIQGMPAPLFRDALSYCSLLIPPVQSPTKPFGVPQSSSIPIEELPDPHDLLLTSHARLMTIFNEWRHGLERISHLENERRVFLSQLKRLAVKVKGDLRWWHEDFQDVARDSCGRRSNLKGADKLLKWKYTEMTWAFAKIHVNSTVARALEANNNIPDPLASNTATQPDTELREASIALVIDGALEILDICKGWTPREEITMFGPTYLKFITVAGSELVSCLGEGRERNVDLDDVISLLRWVSESLFMGNLHEQHVTRMTGSSLLYYCDELQKLKGSERQ